MRLSEPLPEFERPPVFETGMVVCFDAIPHDLVSSRLAAFWNLMRADFPALQLVPPVEVPIEKFGAVDPPQFKIELGQGAPPQRWFMISGNNEHLLQVQHNVFGRNWRKLSADAEYPRYEKVLRPHFASGLQKFFSCLESEGATPPPRLLQCEMVYVNHIVAGRAWQTHADAASVFTSVKSPEVPSFLKNEEHGQVHRLQILNSDGTPCGRLHVTIEPGLRSGDRAPLYQMTLTARGAPLHDGIDGAMDFFDLARESIVRTFTSLTTSTMHNEWERKR